MTVPSSLLSSSRRADTTSIPKAPAPRGMGFQMRVVLALLVTAALPLLTAIALANTLIQRVTSTAFQPEYSQHLDRSLEVYEDLVRNMQAAMNNEGAAIAVALATRSEIAGGDRQALEAELARVLGDHPTLLSIDVERGGAVIGAARRPRPLDSARERPFPVNEEAGGGPDAFAVRMVFAANRQRLDEMDAAHRFATAWKAFADEQRREWFDRPYLTQFALLFAITVALALIVGVLVVRPVIRRLNQLAAATKPVAEGDLSVRVEDDGRDEITDLAVAFNRMLEQLGKSRARIDFLKRVGEWQQMARKLAHEIKNPLTPIQLAVEECHRRYQGNDESYRRMLDTTRDIVIEEVEALRRLVSEFAAFARLPRAALAEGDLGEFLREQKARLLREDIADDETVELTIEIEEGEIPVALDRQLLYRVLSNLVENAIQSAKAEHDSAKVRIRAITELDSCLLEVEDDGPGVPLALGLTIFDPYVTTKADGSGLGLTIVKKIVIDHGGQIELDASPLGGACFRVRLPVLGTQASEAALARSEAAPFSG